MQAEKNFIWSEADIKDVIRYHTSISDRLRFQTIKFRSCCIHQKWDFSDHVCQRLATFWFKSEWSTRHSESAKTVIQNDKSETIISLSWHENNHQSE
jgi:hypothetical protein